MIRETEAKSVLPEEVRPMRWIRRGPGAVEKLSPGGKHIGWYRNGQTSGRPSRDMPLQRDLEALTAAHWKALQAAVPRPVHAAVLGRRSAEARRQNSKAERIVAADRALHDAGVPKHRRSRVIADQLACTVEYVRRVLRRVRTK